MARQTKRGPLGDRKQKNNTRRKLHLNITGLQGGRTEVMYAEPTEVMIEEPKQLVLRLQGSPDPLTSTNSTNMPPSAYEPVTMRDVRQHLQTMQNTTMTNVKSNYQYFSMMKVDHDFDHIMQTLFAAPNTTQKLDQQDSDDTDMYGGALCDGEMLLDKANKNDFLLMSRLKNFVEVKHDFKRKTNAENYQLNFETELLNASQKVMDTLISMGQVGEEANGFHTQVLAKYNSDTTTETEREKMYMKDIIDHMNTNCDVINTLHLTKYISDSKQHGKDYIDQIVAGNGDSTPDCIYEYEGFGTTGKSSSHTTPDSIGVSDTGNEKIYISTIDNKPISKVFTLEQTQFAFTDNSISDKILYPHVYDVPNNKINVGGELSEFSGKLASGKIDTIPSFMDPANGSYDFQKTNVEEVSDDPLSGKKKRIQELQSMTHIYSYPFLQLLAESINDFCNYYGSTLSIDMSELDNLIVDKAEFDLECAAYINTGNEEELADRMKKIDSTKFPIQMGTGAEKGIVSFKMKGLTGRIITNPIKLMVRDTTIESISSFMNDKRIFNKSGVEITIPSIESHKAFFTMRYSRLYDFGLAIYNNIPPEKRKSMLAAIDKPSLISKEAQLLCIIIVSLKAFGDASQVNYSKRVNNYLKKIIKFPVGIGIRTTDKNVFAESILYHNPFWFMNNGLKPHADWVNRKFPDHIPLFDSYKIFISNCDKSDDKIYYDEIIKNLKRFALLRDGESDKTTHELNKTIRRGDISLDDDSDDEPMPTSAPAQMEQPAEFTLNGALIDNIKRSLEEALGIDFEKTDNSSEFLSSNGISVLKDMLQLPSDSDPSSVEELTAGYKKILISVNLYVATLNDYMLNIFHKDKVDGMTEFDKLLNEYIKNTKKLADQILKIHVAANGFMETQKTLLTKIDAIQSTGIENTITKLHAGLSKWVSENMEQSHIDGMNESVESYNASMAEFIKKIPEDFEKTEVKSSGRRTIRKTYQEADESAKILRVWSRDHEANYKMFMDLLYNPYMSLLPEGVHLSDIVKSDQELDENESKPEYIMSQLNAVRSSMVSVYQYVDRMDADVTPVIVDEISKSTSDVQIILTRMASYKYKALGMITKEAEKEKISPAVVPFLYGGEKQTTFKTCLKSLKSSIISYNGEKAIVISDPDVINQMIKEKKGRISFLPLLAPGDTSAKGKSVSGDEEDSFMERVTIEKVMLIDKIELVDKLQQTEVLDPDRLPEQMVVDSPGLVHKLRIESNMAKKAIRNRTGIDPSNIISSTTTRTRGRTTKGTQSGKGKGKGKDNLTTRYKTRRRRSRRSSRK